LTSPQKIQHLINIFPGLSADSDFKLTSWEDDNYNCIAWSLILTNIWFWPSNPRLDGTHWPIHCPRSEALTAFSCVYTAKGYVSCTDDSFEEGFQKIALYEKGGLCTHAARQKSDGYWTSKIGNMQDIQHGDPYVLQGTTYGQVAQLMKRPNSDFKLAKCKKLSKTGSSAI
jgi:hypothetical protein